MFRGLVLVSCLSACSQGVDGADSFTFGPPDPGPGVATDDPSSETSSASDPTLGTDGISDSASPTTGVEETTGDSDAPTSDDPATGPTMTDGTTDEPDDCEPGETRACYTGPRNTENVGICTGGTEMCGVEGTWDGVCDGEILPGASEICDGEDNDCNGSADDGDPGGGGACNTGLSGPCQPGTLTCVNGALICDGDVTPAADEICGNGIDDDCNGPADDGCGCDPGSPGLDCGPTESCFPVETFGDEAQCAGPVGAGGQYSQCVDNGDCGPGHVCVNVGTNVYCLQWCTSFAQCPGILDDCVALDPTVWDENQEWGVCYDGLG